MNRTDLKNIICLLVGMITGIMLAAQMLHHPDLTSYCKGNPEVVLTLNGKGLSKGKFFLTCDGKLYEGELEAITHQYTESNNVVYVRPVMTGKPPIDIKLEGNI